MEPPNSASGLIRRKSTKEENIAASSASLGPWASILEDDSASQGSSQAGHRILNNPGDVDISKFKSSAERNVWSKRNPIWRLNKVSKPRMACIEDNNQDWSVKYRPASFSSVLGTHHSDAVGALQSLLRREQLTNLIIAGPPGSGKTALVEVFISEYFGSPEEVQAKVMRLQASELTASHLDMKPRFETFVEAVDRKKEAKPSRLFVIDKFSEAEPAVQSNIQRIMDALSPVARFILIADSAKRILDRLKTSSCVLIPVRAIPSSLALQIVFCICNSERVGFEREGLQAAYKESEGGNVTLFIQAVQRVFVAYEFISEENVTKCLHPHSYKRRAEEKTPVSVLASLAPLSRCDKCTLLPPCVHVPEALLIERAMERRQQLPRYRDALTCRQFARTGACPLFNREGHCSLDHPKNIHIVQFPTVRCKLCTLPYPCGVCKYDRARYKSKAFLESCRSRVLQVQKRLDAPAAFVPPLVLERLKAEARNEMTRIEDEISRVAHSTSMEIGYYKRRLSENQTAMDHFLQLVHQFPVEDAEQARVLSPPRL